MLFRLTDRTSSSSVNATSEPPGDGAGRDRPGQPGGGLGDALRGVDGHLRPRKVRFTRDPVEARPGVRRDPEALRWIKPGNLAEIRDCEFELRMRGRGVECQGPRVLRQRRTELI